MKPVELVKKAIGEIISGDDGRKKLSGTVVE